MHLTERHDVETRLTQGRTDRGGGLGGPRIDHQLDRRHKLTGESLGLGHSIECNLLEFSSG